MDLETTWTSRPFVSHDAPDKNGLRAEILVSKGLAYVDRIEENGKQSKVFLKAKKITKPFYSSLPSSDEKLLPVIKDALEQGKKIYFRFEKVRKRGVDREIPIRDLAKDATTARDNIYKNFVAVSLDGQEWVFSDMALTDPSEDEDTQQATSALHMNRNKEVPQQQSSSSNSFFYAVGAVTSIIDFLESYRVEKDVVLEDERLWVIAQKLIEMCNTVQMSSLKLQKPDMAGVSHTKIRGVMFSLIRNSFPITNDLSTDEALDAYWRNLGNETFARWVKSMELTRNILNP